MRSIWKHEFISILFSRSFFLPIFFYFPQNSHHFILFNPTIFTFFHRWCLFFLTLILCSFRILINARYQICSINFPIFFSIIQYFECIYVWDKRRRRERDRENNIEFSSSSSSHWMIGNWAAVTNGFENKLILSFIFQLNFLADVR